MSDMETNRGTNGETAEKQIASLQNSYQAVIKFIDKMEQVIRFQDKIDIPMNIREIWEVFLGEIQNLIKMDVCALFLVDEKTHEFVLRGASPQDKSVICQDEVDRQIECGMFSWVIKRRKPALVPSLAFDGNKTIIMLPLSTIRKTLGLVLVLTSIEESSITQEAMKLLTMLARQCSLVMENSLLYERLKKEHEYLNRAQAKILQTEKLASMSRLSSGASHEILNPLNIMFGHIQLLLMDKDLSPRISKSLNIMHGQSERIMAIVKSLSQFSLYAKPKREQVPLNNLIGKALLQVGYKVKLDHVKIVKEFDDNLPPVIGNAEYLSQVFFIILSNAVEAMPGGGTLRVYSRVYAGVNVDADQLLKKPVPMKPDSIEIGFEDTGCGIADENINKIFDPFFTTKESENGKGLGLFLCYGIIQDHGGTIDVKSKVNEGTTITIWLPI